MLMAYDLTSGFSDEQLVGAILCDLMPRSKHRTNCSLSGNLPEQRDSGCQKNGVREDERVRNQKLFD
jgi:hypothetical protein